MGRHKTSCTCAMCVGSFSATPVKTQTPFPPVEQDAPPSIVDKTPMQTSGASEKVLIAKREQELMASICAQCDELERRKILSFGPLFRLVRELRILRGAK